MRKILICLIFVVIFSLVQAPASVAWTSVTHDDFVEEVYYFLPADAQQKLNLELMKSASDDPDFKFFDYRFHHYPLAVPGLITGWTGEHQPMRKEIMTRPATHSEWLPIT